MLVTFEPVTTWDVFVKVGLDYRTYWRRAADESPMGFAGGGTLILLRTGTGWRLVYESYWIT